MQTNDGVGSAGLLRYEAKEATHGADSAILQGSGMVSVVFELREDMEMRGRLWETRNMQAVHLSRCCETLFDTVPEVLFWKLGRFCDQS